MSGTRIIIIESRFGFLTAVTQRNSFFQEVVLYSLAEDHRHFEGHLSQILDPFPTTEGPYS
jgi:hypothetical protein